MSTTDVTGIRWEEPPVVENHEPGRRGRWFTIVAALRARPGEWAIVAEDAEASLGSSIKTGRVGGAKPGEIEVRAVTTGMPRGRAVIYARWVGDSK